MAPVVKDGSCSKADKLRFKKRKECIMKKAKELSVLCDIKVCALITDPDDDQTIQTWPENRLDVQQILKDCVFNKKTVGKAGKAGKVVGDNESLLKMIDEKLECVNKRIECLKQLNNDENQSFFVQDFHANSYIQSSESMNCNTGAESFVQLLESGVSGEFEPVNWSSTIQFPQPVQSIEPRVLGEFEEYQQLLESIPENVIGDGLRSESSNIDTTKEFPYQVFQDYITDEEEWEFLKGLDSLLQTLDAPDQCPVDVQRCYGGLTTCLSL